MLKKILSSFVLISVAFSYYTSFGLSYELLTEIDAANFLGKNKTIRDNSSDTSKYRLKDNISRKETIKIIMNVSGLKVEDNCEGIYKDVKNDWSCKYIEGAQKAGFIAKSDTFRPDDNITKTEAIKMILKAKGIIKTTKTTNWQEDYMQTAFEYGLIPEKFNDYNTNAKRGWIFQVTTSTVKKEQQIKEIQSKNTNLYSEESSQ